MTVCQSADCPASREHDEFGRRVSVEHGGITQPVLSATGHHLLNRYTRGELAAHLKTWNDEPALLRAMNDVEAETNRLHRYLEALDAVQTALSRRYHA